ncbi:outer membrane beta-barrel protein [Longitalea luteola]|uniref:outer membrane beta-barrel protein n=1 Tax=Longitalea luteola TaxID=2812563 RepID=UPI001A95B857|nr:outer membrane beta-barrel protein [Longitalea luteola]
MNFKHPYEKHLAEKLVQLPPPDDPDKNWQQMKALLDKNMPRGGGGSGGSYRWWIAGSLFVAVVVGTFFGGKQLLTREQRSEGVAGTIKTVNNKKAPSVALTEKNSGQPDGSATANNSTGSTTPKNLPGAAYASNTDRDGNGAAADNSREPAGAGNNPAMPSATPSQNDAAVTNTTGKNVPATVAEKARSSGTDDINSRLLPANDNGPDLAEKPTNNNNKIAPDRNKIYTPETSNNNDRRTANDRRTNNRSTVNFKGDAHQPAAPEDNAVAANTSSNKVINKKGKTPVQKRTGDLSSSNRPGSDARGNRNAYTPQLSFPSRSSTGSGLQESPVTYDINYTGATVLSPSGVLTREFTYYTRADLFPELAAKNRSGHRKSSRSPHVHEDKTFAIGLSLPLGFPVGDQTALAYNRNAGVNTISDYIPSPHFQYHFNRKTYVQAGFQFSAPQFIKPLLLFQDQKMIQAGPNLIEQTTSIHARKLYYFNLPLTVYHSPLRNFYMGTGLQFSSLLSGVANHQKVEKRFSPIGPPQEYVIENHFARFKNDWLSSKLNGNEVRLLLDMSYYWSRFTVGLQYSQAFNNYVSFQVTPSSPYTFDKNKSLQFYLRYNIWEDQKRKLSKGQSALSLK